MSDLLTPDYARNMRILGHSDQGGKMDGCQIMVSNGYAYVGHVFNNGFSIMDVRDPKNPKFVKHIHDGKGIVEDWTVFDQLAVIRQIYEQQTNSD